MTEGIKELKDTQLALTLIIATNVIAILLVVLQTSQQNEYPHLYFTVLYFFLLAANRLALIIWKLKIERLYKPHGKLILLLAILYIPLTITIYLTRG
jgi:hypothetical protein